MYGQSRCSSGILCSLAGHVSSILHVLLCVAVLPAALSTAGTQARAADPDAPRESKSITVAVSIDQPPFYFRDQEGRSVGLLVDLWKLWSHTTGIPVKYKSADWHETIAMVRDGRADVHGGLYFSDDRDTYLDFGQAITTCESNFFFHESVYKLKGLKDLAGFKIGILKGDFSKEYVKRFIDKPFFAEYPTYQELFSAAKQGEIKVFVADVPSALYYLAKNDLIGTFRFHSEQPLFTKSVLPAVKEGRSALLEEVNRGFRMIGESDRAQIHRAWLSGAAKRREGVLIIVCPKGYAPFSMLNANGKPSGMFVDIWRLWGKKTGKEIEFIVSDWNKSLEELRTGAADIHAGLFPNPSIGEWAAFSQPFYKIDTVLFYQADTGDFGRLRDLSGHKIGALLGSFQAGDFRQAYPDIEPVLFRDREELITALTEGRVRAVIAERRPTLALANMLGKAGDIQVHEGALFSDNICAATAKQNKKLFSLVDQGLDAITDKEMREIESRWIADPEARYYKEGAARLRLTGVQQNWLERHKTIRISGDPEWPPVDFAKDGEHAGMSSDYLDIIAERLGVKFVYEPSSSWADLLKKAEAKEIDLVTCIQAVDERRDFLDFTKPYLQLPIVIMTRNEFPFITGLEDLAGRRVAVVEDYSIHAFLKRDYPDLDLKPVQSVRSGLELVSTHRIDAFVVGLPVSAYLIQKLGLANLKVAANTQYRYDLSFGVRKDWPQLTGILNKAVSTFTEEERNNIYQKWVSVRFEHGIDTAYVRKMVLTVVAISLVILSIGLVWYLQLKRREERFRGLTEHGMDVTQAFRRDGTIVYQSPSHKPILGYERDELQGTSVHDLVHPYDRAVWEATIASLDKDAGVKQCEHRMRHKDGRYRDFETNFIDLLHKKPLQAIVINARDVTERKAAQDELENEKQRFRTLIQKAPFGLLVVGTDGNFQYVNERFEDLFGYSLADIPSGAAWMEAAFPDPEYRREVLSAWQEYEKAMDSGSATPVTFRVLTKSGEEKTIRFKAVRLAQGETLIACEDITQLKRTEANLAAQLARFQAMYDVAVAMTVAGDLDRNLKHVVETTRKILSAETSFIALHDTDRNAVCMHACSGVRTDAFKKVELPTGSGLGGEVAQSGKGRIVYDYYTEVGPGAHQVVRDEGLVSGIAAPVQIDGANLGVLYVFNRRPTEFSQTDLDAVTLLGNLAAVEITRKRAEKKLEDAVDVSTQLRREAEAANRAKSGFLANMSHELRTPLNAIIGYSEMLIEDAEDMGEDDFVADLKRIMSAGRHLLELINGVLDLSKIEAGKMELFLETFDIHAALDEIIGTVQPLVDKNENTLVTRFDENLGFMHADMTKVRQSLLNLLSNACKFTELGKVILECHRESAGGRDLITFIVQDSGIGMTPEQVRKVFEPFVQADDSTTKKYGGTGLGLVITKRFSEMMGGFVDVESEAGKGTTFTLKLPADVTISPEELQPSDETVPQERPAGRPTILVIDDEASARDLTGRYLKKEGFHVLTASSGSEGIRIAGEQEPDAIILDVIMPGMDGWAVLSELKADPKLASIPVIMLTVVDDRGTGYALGASDYISKPIDQHRLARVLKKYRSGDGSPIALVVEDDGPTREMFRRILEKEGWKVAEAENGRIGLKKLSEQIPTLVLLDLMMPEVDGFQFLTSMRENELWDSVPVVVVTSKDLTSVDRERLEGRVKTILQKGAYSREELLKEVRDLVRKSLGDPQSSG